MVQLGNKIVYHAAFTCGQRNLAASNILRYWCTGHHAIHFAYSGRYIYSSEIAGFGLSHTCYDGPSVSAFNGVDKV